MAFLPLFMLGILLKSIRFIPRIQCFGTAAMTILGLSCLWPIVNSAFETEELYKIRCADYAQYSCREYILDGERIYVPDQGDQAGYEAFPSTPYVNRLDKIELRGETLKEGFRMREEYREAFVSTYGEAYAENMFE